MKNFSTDYPALKMKHVGFLINDEDDLRLRIIAAHQHISKSEVIRRAISEYLKKGEGNNASN